MINAYKKAIADAEPVGAFVNDNIMVVDRGLRRRGRRPGRRAALATPTRLPGEQRLPLPRHLPAPRGHPVLARAASRPDARDRASAAAESGLIVRRPRPGARAVPAVGGAGADQLVFGIGAAARRTTLETIRLMGEHVIPKIDTDPVHRTTATAPRHRRACLDPTV